MLNYCKIGKKYIDYFFDTTPEKHNKFMPGVKIPVKKYVKLDKTKVEYAFLGAWNFKKEIFKKEKIYKKKRQVYNTCSFSKNNFLNAKKFF